MTNWNIDDLPEHMREQARAQMQSSGYVCVHPPGLVSLGPEVVAAIEALKPKPRKYHNEPITVDGHTFASRWEAQRYRELRNMVDAGLIFDLRMQVEFALEVASLKGPVRVAAYFADFTYRRPSGVVTPPPFGELSVEDCKSAATKRDKTYVLKRAMFEAQYGIRIIEVERQRRKQK